MSDMSARPVSTNSSEGLNVITTFLNKKMNAATKVMCFAVAVIIAAGIACCPHILAGIVITAATMYIISGAVGGVGILALFVSNYFRCRYKKEIDPPIPFNGGSDNYPPKGIAYVGVNEEEDYDRQYPLVHTMDPNYKPEASRINGAQEWLRQPQVGERFGISEETRGKLSFTQLILKVTRGASEEEKLKAALIYTTLPKELRDISLRNIVIEILVKEHERTQNGEILEGLTRLYGEGITSLFFKKPKLTPLKCLSARVTMTPKREYAISHAQEVAKSGDIALNQRCRQTLVHLLEEAHLDNLREDDPSVPIAKMLKGLKALALSDPTITREEINHIRQVAERKQAEHNILDGLSQLLADFVDSLGK